MTMRTRLRMTRQRATLLALALLAAGWVVWQRVTPDSVIVFASDRTGRNEIYRMNDDGTGVRRLMKSPLILDTPTPAVSPDGKHIAYIAHSESKHIWMADIDGKNQRHFTAGWDPAFFPDGRSLVYRIYRSGGIHLYRINLDGTGRRQLTFGKDRDSDPVVSPDGKFIVYASDSPGKNRDIYRMNTDGSGRVRLTSDPASDSSPAISPDGQWIAFVSARGWLDEIYLMDINGRRPRRLPCLTRGAQGACDPTFSPDGQRIAYTVLGGGYTDIAVINVDGNGRKVLTNNWFRSTLRNKLGEGKVSQFLGLNDNHHDIPLAWIPARQAGWGSRSTRTSKVAGLSPYFQTRTMRGMGF